MGSLPGYAKGNLPFVKKIAQYNEVHLMAKRGYFFAMPRRLRMLKRLADILVLCSIKLRRPVNRWEACNRNTFDKIYAAILSEKAPDNCGPATTAAGK